VVDGTVTGQPFSGLPSAQADTASRPIEESSGDHPIEVRPETLLGSDMPENSTRRKTAAEIGSHVVRS
jgi:hypothetical protein